MPKPSASPAAWARLHQADAHLGFARLERDRGDKAAALEYLEKARTLVNDCGYHRRDKDLAELDRDLGVAG